MMTTELKNSDHTHRGAIETWFKPRSDFHLVRFTECAEQTESGIYLPEKYQSNYTECEILKSGTGFLGLYEVVQPWTKPGDTVVIEKHSFSPIVGYKEGLIRDSDVVAIVLEDGLWPLNDWVMLEVPRRESMLGSIELPEELQQKPNRAQIIEIGPGRLCKSGKYAGIRTPIYDTLNVGSACHLSGKTAVWSDDATILEIGRDSVSALFIRAEDICGILEED